MSTDGTREWIQEQTDIRYILNDENKGFPAGCNQGAALADEENDIFLLNNDTIVMTNSIYNLRMALHEEERTGAVGAVTNFAGANQMIAEKFSTIEEYVAYAGKNNAYSPSKHDKRLRLIGFAMMVQGDVWREVDGFDERYGKGNFEDDDLGLKILTHDYHMRLCKDSFIYHFGSVSFREASKKEPDSYRGLLGKNRDQFNEKWNIKWGYFSHVRNELIDLIQEPKDKKFSVLEVGCASGATLVEIENRYLHAVTYGFELNKTVAQIASHYVNVLPGDVEEKVNYFNVTYDYIILGNVLEHIHNPEDILKTLKTWLKPEGRFIISLPNIMHISVVMPLLRGRFEYKGEGVLDRTHLRFFTKTEIILLMEQCSLQIDRMGASMLELSKEQERYITRLCEMDGAIPKEELSAYQYWIVARSKGE
jgi:2-polyprenyl-3-methyl-5-hydroxy-6-metoxy-1,4-benzoquinol methylase